MTGDNDLEDWLAWAKDLMVDIQLSLETAASLDADGGWTSLSRPSELLNWMLYLQREVDATVERMAEMARVCKT